MNFEEFERLNLGLLNPSSLFQEYALNHFKRGSVIPRQSDTTKGLRPSRLHSPSINTLTSTTTSFRNNPKALFDHQDLHQLHTQSLVRTLNKSRCKSLSRPVSCHLIWALRVTATSFSQQSNISPSHRQDHHPRGRVLRYYRQR